MLLVAANGGTLRLYTLPDMTLRQTLEYNTWPNTVRVERSISPRWVLTGGDSGQFNLLCLRGNRLRVIDAKGCKTDPEATSVFCVVWNARGTLVAVHRTASIELFRASLEDKANPSMELVHTFYPPSIRELEPRTDMASDMEPLHLGESALSASSTGLNPEHNDGASEVGMYGSVAFSEFPELLVMTFGSLLGVADLSQMQSDRRSSKLSEAPLGPVRWRLVDDEVESPASLSATSVYASSSEGLSGLIVDPDAKYLVTATKSSLQHYSVS